MVGAQIILLLACGGIIVEAYGGLRFNAPAGKNIFTRRNNNVNSNTNTNIVFRGHQSEPESTCKDDIEKSISFDNAYGGLRFNAPAGKNIFTRRNNNVNSNTNTNIVFRGHQSEPESTCKDDIEKSISFDNVRRRLYDVYDPNTASVASAAANAALSITKIIIHDLSESIAITVAESVAKILKRQTDLANASRRNNNINNNINVNTFGQEGIEEPQLNQGSDRDYIDMSNGLAERYPNFGEVLPDEREMMVPENWLWNDDYEVEKNDDLPRRKWDYVRPRSGYQTNSNVNTNINSFGNPAQQNVNPKRNQPHPLYYLGSDTSYNPRYNPSL